MIRENNPALLVTFAIASVLILAFFVWAQFHDGGDQ